jgi:hypothetical protein
MATATRWELLWQQMSDGICNVFLGSGHVATSASESASRTRGRRRLPLPNTGAPASPGVQVEKLESMLVVQHRAMWVGPAEPHGEITYVQSTPPEPWSAGG